MKILHNLISYAFLAIALPISGCRKNDQALKLQKTTVDTTLQQVALPPEKPVCKVNMPQAFKHERLIQPGVEGEFFSHESESKSCSVMLINHVLGELTPAETDTVINRTRDGTIQGVNGRLVSESIIEVQNRKGVECDVRVGADRVLMRVIATESHVYQLMWLQKLDNFNEKSAKVFFDSFEIL